MGIKFFLIIVFIAGLKHSIDQWLHIYGNLFELGNIYRRGYNPNDYPDCTCDSCKNFSQAEKEEHKENNYNADVALLVKTIKECIAYALFITGIILIILYLIFN